ncbi:unnamed protein product [Protopolystoma xenopodis]|uniref:Ionotropic glutamate receptor C-terminal domain-containing protein n=1 Tax=Protopolystoma xenopodis TaxID=117903 RepID=A0A448WZN5_9PLAT|nr:unnamed protein product [Protopolystoma xenopodis]
MRHQFSVVSNFMFFTDSFLYNNATSTSPSYFFHFLQPLTWQVWLAVVLIAFGVGLFLAILHFISPNQVNYGLYESLFVSFGNLFHGLTVTPPDRIAGRILIAFWWLFILLFTAIYIANYGALQTSKRLNQGLATFNVSLRRIHKFGTCSTFSLSLFLSLHDSYNALVGPSVFAAR